MTNGMRTPTQTQEIIPVIFAGDTMSTATRRGNNAAWICICGYGLPLIWAGNTLKATICPECKRQYIGEGQEHPQASPKHITGGKSSEIDSEDCSTIPVKLKNGQEHIAVRKGEGGGGNAAWMCVCGYRLPLLWSSFPKPQFPTKSRLPVKCAECDRIYKGIIENGEGIEKIEEV